MLAATEHLALSAERIVALLDEAQVLSRRLESEADRSATLETLIDRVQLSDSGIQFSIRLPGAGSVQPIVIHQHVPIKIRRRGAELRLILSTENGARPLADRALLGPIARAHRWFNQLLNGQIESIPAIATREGIGVRHVRSLSPEIVEAIAEGRQPLELTAEVLIKQSGIPLSCREQWEVLGFDTTSGGQKCSNHQSILMERNSAKAIG